MINFLKNLIFGKPSLNLKEVFKIGGIPKYTFVNRKSISSEILQTVKNKERALLFLGYSKSGKTVYRKNLFPEDQYITLVFRCNKNSQISDLYNLIASELKLGQIITTTDASGIGYSASTTATVKAPEVFETSTGVSAQANYSYAKTEEHAKVRVDVNFLCNKIKKKENLIIILEDYHLVNSEFNNILSEDLKHFIDEEIQFLLIGIPSAPDRALKNNPDLSGRLKHINFDYLTNIEVEELIKKGARHLNVEFSKEVIEEICEVSLKNAFLVQFICQKTLELNEINYTSKKKIQINNINEIHKACKAVAQDLDKDYSAVYEVISSGVRRQQDDKVYNQYEEVLKAIKKTPIEALEKGVYYTEIATKTHKEFSNDEIDELIAEGRYKDKASFKGAITNQVRQAVERIESTLEKGSTRDIILVQDMKIFVMDLIFKFYLNWRGE